MSEVYINIIKIYFIKVPLILVLLLNFCPFSLFGQKVDKYVSLSEKIETSIQSNPLEATTLINLMEDWAKKDNDLWQMSRSLIYKGDLEYKNKNLILSSNAYLKALSLIERYNGINYDSLKTYALAYTASNYVELEMWDEAIVQAKKGVVYAKLIKDKSYLADYYSILGASYFYLGDYNISTVHFDSCLSVEKSLRDTMGIIKVLNNVAKLNADERRYDVSLNYYQDALELLETGIMDSLIHAKVSANIGDLFAAREEYDKAIFYINKAKLLAKADITDKFNTTLSLSLLEYYRKKGETDKAMKIAESIEKKLLTPDESIYCNYLISIGNLHKQLGQYAMAENKAILALNLAKKLNLKRKQQSALQLLFDIQRATNKLPQALIYLDQLSEINDQINKDENAKTLTIVNAKYRYHKQLLEIERLKGTEIEKNARIAKLKWQNTWFVSLGILLLLIFGLVFYLFRQKIKQKLVSQQQIIERQQEFINNAQFVVKKQLDPDAKNSESNVLNIEQINQNIKTPLTEREYEILLEIYNGLSNHEIGEKLYLSVNTVNFT